MSSNGAYEANEEIFRSRVLGELQAIKAALQAAESAPPAPNAGSPKLLDEMEQFAVMCDRAGNSKDARCVRSWVKQLRASA